MQDLNVDKHIIANKIKPGEYLILLFSFPQILQVHNPDEFVKSLRNVISHSVKRFYDKYGMLLGKSTEGLVRSVDMSDPISTLEECINSTTKALLDAKGDKTHLLTVVKGVSGVVFFFRSSSVCNLSDLTRIHTKVMDGSR